MEITPQ